LSTSFPFPYFVPYEENHPQRTHDDPEQQDEIVRVRLHQRGFDMRVLASSFDI